MPSITKSVSFIFLVGASGVFAAPTAEVQTTATPPPMTGTSQQQQQPSSNPCIVQTATGIIPIAGISEMLLNAPNNLPAGCTLPQVQSCAAQETTADIQHAVQICPAISTCPADALSTIWQNCLTQAATTPLTGTSSVTSPPVASVPEVPRLPGLPDADADLDLNQGTTRPGNTAVPQVVPTVPIVSTVPVPLVPAVPIVSTNPIGSTNPVVPTVPVSTVPVSSNGGGCSGNTCPATIPKVPTVIGTPSQTGSGGNGLDITSNSNVNPSRPGANSDTTISFPSGGPLNGQQGAADTGVTLPSGGNGGLCPCAPGQGLHGLTAEADATTSRTPLVA